MASLMTQDPKMEILELTQNEREVLFEVLGIDPKKIKCKKCGKKVSFVKCSVMPSLNFGDKADIICGSPLCLSSWFRDREDALEKVKAIKHISVNELDWLDIEELNILKKDVEKVLKLKK